MQNPADVTAISAKTNLTAIYLNGLYGTKTNYDKLIFYAKQAVGVVGLMIKSRKVKLMKITI